MENQKHTARPLSSTADGANQSPDDPLFEEAYYQEDYGAAAGDVSPPALTAEHASVPVQLPAQLPASQTPSIQTPAPTDALDFVPAYSERDRVDGWTPQRQRDFIGMLADTGCVSVAAESVGMSESGAYKLRRSVRGQTFAYAWEIAIRQASRRLVDVAFERAVQGVEEPVFDRDGQCRNVRRKYNDRLLMFLLRAHNPAQYGIGDERFVGLDKREGVEDWANGYTPLTAALEVIHPTLDEDGGDA